MVQPADFWFKRDFRCKAAAVNQLVAEEVFKAIHEDEDIRILLREYVRDAISKMNLQDVITAAVSHALIESHALKSNSE